MSEMAGSRVLHASDETGSSLRLGSLSPAFWMTKVRKIHSTIGLQSARLRTTFGDEAVDGLVGVVLEGRVGQVGEEVCLVDHGTSDDRSLPPDLHSAPQIGKGSMSPQRVMSRESVAAHPCVQAEIHCTFATR
jgi:hypothetical protein